MSILYAIIFIFVFTKLTAKGLMDFSPKDAKTIGSSVISLINAIICSFGGVFALFYHMYWKSVNTKNEPGVTFYGVAAFSAYFFIDTIIEILLYLYFKNNKKLKIPLDVTIIAHHILSLFPLAIEIPKPVYYWFYISLIMMLESSTIFLNLQIFGKHFDGTVAKKLRKYSKLGFVLSWFVVRVPVFVLIWWKIISQFNKFISISFVRSCIGLIAFAVLTLLNGGWTVVIIQKIIGYLNKTETKKNIHASHIQFGSSQNEHR
eukprot:144912_1